MTGTNKTMRGGINSNKRKNDTRIAQKQNIIKWNEEIRTRVQELYKNKTGDEKQ